MRLRADTPEQLAAILRGRRQSNGLTQRQAGAQVGLLQKTVSSLETEPSGSSIASLYKLLSALELDLVLEHRPSGVREPKASGW
ncbi:MAG: helix-turn-helix domain-containing protein [Arenimonas sp.]|nr:helix-turn-helix domain-containing protein [Arenimonas sp.]